MIIKNNFYKPIAKNREEVSIEYISLILLS